MKIGFVGLGSMGQAIASNQLKSGLLDTLEAPLIHVNLAPLAVDFAEELAERHQARGFTYIAAPVMGRPSGHIRLRGQLMHGFRPLRASSLWQSSGCRVTQKEPKELAREWTSGDSPKNRTSQPLTLLADPVSGFVRTSCLQRANRVNT
ncbi:NAD(P)-dependent oxidoreductase [Pseudomonas asplenii]|uniref:NAD(P)-dependent oxidoreductase n=1 Tax=Pseudomonas asplenii TaxID=53407 RepID=UPI00037A6650|nr:NAD(P)-dependent oxidoreductase [Pseudomonas fuscovaginae]